MKNRSKLIAFPFYLVVFFIFLFTHSVKSLDHTDFTDEKRSRNFLQKKISGFKNSLVYALKEIIVPHFRFHSMRKTHLIGLGGLLMSSVAYTLLSQEEHLPLTKQPEIAVIGAGLSGLTMGYRLKQKGYENFSIYEAKPRVGGRVHSVYVKNSEGGYSIAELGGHNITDGGEAKHFLTLAHELGLEIEEDPYCLSRGFYADGKLYNSKEILRTCGFSQEDIQKILSTLPPSSHSMRDVIDHVFKENLLLKRIFTYHVGSYEGLPTKDLAIFHNIETFKLFLPGGKATFQEPTGTDEPFLFKYIKGGNSKLPLTLSRMLEGKVFLNKALRKVSRHKKRIKLEFTDGTVVMCDKLILSTPCSTFKNITWEGDIIPKEKLNAIQRVQYGANAKVVVPLGPRLKQPTYSSVTAEHIGTLENNDRKLLMFFTDGIWGASLIQNLTRYYPFMAEMVEANYGRQENFGLTPVTASEEAYKRYDQPVIKSWFEDPYAQGSYSAIGNVLGSKFLEQVNFKNTRFKSMFTPINNQIFFIGEHTSIIEEMGSMEAAVESAERLAQLF